MASKKDINIQDMVFDLGGVDVSIPSWIKNKNFRCAKTIEEVREYIDKAISNGIASLDTETEGLDTRVYLNEETNKYETVHKIVGFCVSADIDSGMYIPIRHKRGIEHNLDIDLVEKEITRLGENTLLVFHNSKFDLEMLEFMGNPLSILKHTQFEDTQIALFIRDPNDKRTGLKIASQTHLGVTQIELEELFPKSTTNLDFSELSPTDNGVAEYGCSDACCTLMLWEQIKWVAEKYKVSYTLEKALIGPLRRMERNRVLIDVDLIKQLKIGAEERREEIVRLFLEAQKPYCNENETFEISSPQQISTLLYERIGIPTEDILEKGETDHLSTSKNAVDLLKEKFEDRYPILDYIIEYRMLHNVITKFHIPMIENVDSNNEGRLQFNALVADTARLSSSKGKDGHGFLGINSHAIPRPKDNTKPEFSRLIRKAIKARPGFVIAKIDFSGEELRIATNLSKEPKWIKEFNEGSGDLHTLMSINIFGNIDGNNRSYAKNVNFALLYGGGPGAVKRNTKLPMITCKDIVKKYFEKVPILKKWIDTQKKFAKANKIVYSAMGRPFPLPQMESGDPSIIAFGERKAINSPIQGTGADIIKTSIVRVDKLFRDKNWWPEQARLLMNVHDELVIELKKEILEEALPLICDEMTLFGRQMKWEVPLEVEPLIGESWFVKNDWNKMKLGEEEIPDFLKGFITVDRKLSGVARIPEIKLEPQVKKQTVLESSHLISNTTIDDSEPLNTDSKDNKEPQHIKPQMNERQNSMVNVNQLFDIPDVYKYELTSPLNTRTYNTLKNICTWASTPTLVPASTILVIKNMADGKEIIGENLNIRVDLLKFIVLAETFNL